MDNAGMATVKAVGEGVATIELGSGEIKNANFPREMAISDTDKVLVMQVAGKYLIINVY